MNDAEIQNYKSTWKKQMMDQNKEELVEQLWKLKPTMEKLIEAKQLLNKGDEQNE